jgi:hypothetical protein
MAMYKFILKFIKTEKLWEEILNRENIIDGDFEETENVWKSTYNRNPELKNWLKKREIMLLRSFMFNDKSIDFIKGQLAENRLYQSFDTPQIEYIPKVDKEEIKIPDKKEFINAWNKKEKEK